MWIISALPSRLRRKMIAIFERPSILLTLLAITGIICGALFTILWAVVPGDNDFLNSPSGTLLTLAMFAGGSGVVLGIIVGGLTVAALTVGVLARILAGLLHSAFTSTRPAPANLSVGTDAPWSIRAAAVFMPPSTADGGATTSTRPYSTTPLTSTRIAARLPPTCPATIAWAWTATLQRYVLGANHSRGRQQ